MDISKDFELFNEFTKDYIPTDGADSSPYYFYNAAVDKIRQGSDDMAIILLKKAVSCDEFVPEAYALLALCLYKNKEEEEALELLKTVIKKDPGNTVAHHYIEKLFNIQNKKKPKDKPQNVDTKAVVKTVTDIKTEPKQKRAKKTEAVHSTKQASNNIREKIVKKETGNKTKSLMPVITAIVLILFAGGVVGYLIGYDASKAGLSDMNDLMKQYQDQIQGYRENETVLTNDIANLQKNINDLTENNKALLQAIQEKDLEIKQGNTRFILSDIQALLSENDYETAVLELDKLSVNDLDEDIRQIYNRLYEQTYEKLCTSLYNQGMSLYDNNRFADAHELFDRVIDTGFKFGLIDHVYYRAGRCIYELGNYEEAINYFDYLSENYAEFQYIDYATYYKGRSYQFLGEYTKAKEIYIFARDNYTQTPLRNSIFARINEINAILNQ